MSGIDSSDMYYLQSIGATQYCGLVEDGACSDISPCVFRNTSIEHVGQVRNPRCKVSLEEVVQHLKKINYEEVL